MKMPAQNEKNLLNKDKKFGDDFYFNKKKRNLISRRI